LGDAAVSGTNFSKALSLSEGLHRIRATAEDAAGHVSADAFFDVFVDLTAPPAPSITSAPPALSHSGAATFAFGDAEAAVRFMPRLDGGGFAVASSPQTFSGLADGGHTFTVEALDAAGNVSQTTSFTWVVDASAPTGPTIVGIDPDTGVSASDGVTNTRA